MKQTIYSIEKAVRIEWQKKNIFATDINASQEKKYILEMFPYPSGNLHMGHVRNYSIGDVLSRYYHAKGFNVIHPMGWDAFGLPAENAAIDNDTSPQKWTERNIAHMKAEMIELGQSYDWSMELSTCDPDYYAHEQEFFIKMLEHGIAYRKESFVNWDPIDCTVLSNEQVIDGRGWRSGALIERKKIKQWFLKITDFAEDLLNNIDQLEWPDSVKRLQKNWIGKSQGIEIDFLVYGIDSIKNITVFTTKIESIFGCSFLAISTEHPIVLSLIDNDLELYNFINKNIKNRTNAENYKCLNGYKIKNISAINPINNQRIPIYIADYVLSDYGSGAIFGCPAVDKRDLDFANKYGIEIIDVLSKDTKINSELISEMGINEARDSIFKHLSETKIAKKVTNYRLKDWGISRQRYWGCPIPIIYCKSCGMVANRDLPLKLPKVDKCIRGLSEHVEWKTTKCPQCNSPAERETDTFDTFFESSWYYMAFLNKKKMNIDRNLCKKFLPVDIYIGGIEHAILHLLYSRFFCLALARVDIIESVHTPFQKLVAQGMILCHTYKDREGNFITPAQAEGSQNIEIGHLEKMSKSKKNIVSPETIIKEYGSDAIRLFLLSDNPPEKDIIWKNDGVKGCYKFIKKIYDFYYENKIIKNLNINKDDLFFLKINSIIINLDTHITSIKLNSAIAEIRKLFNLLNTQPIEREHLCYGFTMLLRVMEPFTPHLSHFLWKKISNDEESIIYNEPWPSFIREQDKECCISVQINGKFKHSLITTLGTAQEEMLEMIRAKRKIDIDNNISNIIYKKDVFINFITHKE